MPIAGQVSGTNFQHGTHGATSTLTDVTTKMRGVNMSLDGEEVDATVFGDGFRSYEQSFKNGTIEATYKYDTTVWGQLTAIYNGSDSVDFQFGPTGIATGAAKITGAMIITKIGAPAQVGNLLEIPVSFRITGAVTFDTFA